MRAPSHRDAASTLAFFLVACAPGPDVFVGAQADASLMPLIDGSSADAGDTVAPLLPDSGSSACDPLGCAGQQPYCDESAGTCVQCLQDAHCSGAQPRCDPALRQCVECVSNDDCPGSFCETWEGHCSGFGFGST